MYTGGGPGRFPKITLGSPSRFSQTWVSRGRFLTRSLSFILIPLIEINFLLLQKKVYAKRTRIKLGDANYFLDTQGALENGIPTQQTALWIFFPASSL